MNTIFEQARSYGTPLVLAHQYYGQLKESQDVDMTQNVDANCVTAIDLGTPDQFSMQRIEELSPLVRYAKLSWQQLASGVGDPQDGREFDIGRAAAQARSGGHGQRQRGEGTALQRQDDPGHLEDRTERLVPRPGPPRLHPAALRDAVRLGAPHPGGDVPGVRRAELAGGRRRDRHRQARSVRARLDPPRSRRREKEQTQEQKAASEALRDRIDKYTRRTQ